jgi:hypothetical protein
MTLCIYSPCSKHPAFALRSRAASESFVVLVFSAAAPRRAAAGAVFGVE